MFKKGLVFGIILLFLFVNIYPSSAIDTVKKTINPLLSNGNTLYVGGSGPGNYTKIMDAIDNASEGDTVFVYDDSSPYYERVYVDKSINLIGEDRNTTIIQCNEEWTYFLNVLADNVTICGFTINRGLLWSVQFQECSDGAFYNNNIYPTRNGLGIILMNSERINVSNNYIIGGGILINDCSNCVIKNNFIDNMSGMKWQSSGISIGYSKKIRIIHNHISDFWNGILLEESKSIRIIQNNIVNHFRSARVWNSFVFWDSNYWGRPRILPKLIFGFYYILPIIYFDWHPAKEPYDIGV